MAKIEHFEEIEAWKEARKLSVHVYAITRSRLFRIDSALTDQMRRASVSVMANIAEGFDAGSNREFVKFPVYALRSATEVQSHLYVALDQIYISGEEFVRLYEETRSVKNLIGGFRRYLRARSATAAQMAALEPRRDDAATQRFTMPRS